MQAFNYDGREIRTILIDGQPWFVGKDVAEALGYSNSRDALSRHVDAEDKNTVVIPDGKGNPNQTIINESGLYSLILSSKLPSAKVFKRWVTSEVLPCIHKQGMYVPESLQTGVSQRPITVDDYLKCASIVSNCRNERLPYVLGFLEQGGFSIPEIEEIAGDTAKVRCKRNYLLSSDEAEIQGKAQEIIRIAVKNYGFTYEQIGQMTGFARNVIWRYGANVNKPNPKRAKLIVEVITEALPEKSEAENND